MEFSGKSTEVNCHSRLQGIFLTQGLNLGLPHCRWILYCLSHQGSLNSNPVYLQRASTSQTSGDNHCFSQSGQFAEMWNWKALNIHIIFFLNWSLLLTLTEKSQEGCLSLYWNCSDRYLLIRVSKGSEVGVTQQTRKKRCYGLGPFMLFLLLQY